jgi:hypothetical protein
VNPVDERSIRARFRRAELPAAPDSLKATVAAVVATPPTEGLMTAPRRAAQLLLPIAAVLVIVAAAVLGGGSPTQPPAGSGTPEPTTARLIVEPAVFESCGPSGCAYHLFIDGPGVAWHGQLGFAGLGAVSPLAPESPGSLSSGRYAMRAEIHVISDAIEEGQTEPRDLGTTATCTTEVDVPDGTEIVAVSAGFWLDRCAVGALVAADPRTLATFAVVSSFEGKCGGSAAGCEYRLRLSGSGGTWATTLKSPNPPDQVAISPDLVSFLAPGSYRLDASAHRMSDEPAPGAGHRRELSVATTCSVEFTVAGDTTTVDAVVTFAGETCSIEADAIVLGTEAPGLITPAPTPVPIQCDEAEPSRMTCADIVDAVLEALSLQGGGSPIIEVVVTRQCDEPCVPEMESAAVALALGPPALNTLSASLIWTPSGPFVQGVFSSERALSPPYGDEPSLDMTVPIEGVALLPARDTLKVQFYWDECSAVYRPWLEAAGNRLRVAIVAQPTDPPPPSGALCSDPFRITYALVLPEPFHGSVVEDISNGRLFEVEPG